MVILLERFDDSDCIITQVPTVWVASWLGGVFHPDALEWVCEWDALLMLSNVRLVVTTPPATPTTPAMLPHLLTRRGKQVYCQTLAK